MEGAVLDRYGPAAGDVLTAILRYSRDCIKLLNLHGELEYFSASARDALGIVNDDDAIGRRWRDFWPEGARATIDAAVAEAIAGASVRFDGVVPDGTGRERSWKVVVSPVRGAEGAITHVLAVSTDATAEAEAAKQSRLHLEQAEERAGFADSVAREMRHRLKNQLAVIGAISRLLARHSEGARELALKLEDKLRALGRAQDLMMDQRDQPLSAAEAIGLVLDASGAGERIEVLAMPDLRLRDAGLQQLALILGELQTNALKHGALRREGGRVRLSGRADGAVLSLLWREDCGEAITPVETGDGGFQLIRRLGGVGRARPSITWHPQGIEVAFHVPTAG